jgi:hypothetical protein
MKLHIIPASLAVLLTACVWPAWSAAAVPASLYQQERQRCLDGRTHQDQRTCLQEANAARDQMRRGLLQTEDAATLAANAVRRCEVHKIEADRKACVSMARGEGEVAGTAATGGVIRAYTTITVGPVPTADAPASAAAASPR